MILLFAAPPAAFADELPADAQAILDESGVDITDAAGWSLSDLCDTLGSWLAEGFQPALHFAAQAAGYLLLAGLLGLLAGSPYSGYVVFSGSKSMKVSVSLENEHNPPPLVPNHIVPFISSNNVITELLVIVVVSSRICSKCSQRSFTVL